VPEITQTSLPGKEKITKNIHCRSLRPARLLDKTDLKKELGGTGWKD
jgi:hypothetical protein